MDKCIKAEEFIDTTNRMYELYKLNLLWHNRIVESRELVCEQLKGFLLLSGAWQQIYMEKYILKKI